MFIDDLCQTPSPTVTKWHAYQLQRSSLSTIPLSLEMGTLPGPIVYVDPPNACTPYSVVAPEACREGAGEIPADAWYIDESSPAIHPHGLQSLFSTTLTPSGWTQEGTVAASGLNSAVWLVTYSMSPDHELFTLTGGLC